MAPGSPQRGIARQLGSSHTVAGRAAPGSGTSMKRRMSRKMDRCFRRSVLARYLLLSVARTLSWAHRNSVSWWHKSSCQKAGDLEGWAPGTAHCHGQDRAGGSRGPAPLPGHLLVTPVNASSARAWAGCHSSSLPAAWLLLTHCSHCHSPPVTSRSWASSKSSAMVSPARMRRATLLLVNSGGSCSQ